MYNKSNPQKAEDIVTGEKIITLAEMQAEKHAAAQLRGVRKNVDPTVARIVEEVMQYPDDRVKRIDCCDKASAQRLICKIWGFCDTRKIAVGSSRSESTVFVYRDDKQDAAAQPAAPEGE